MEEAEKFYEENPELYEEIVEDSDEKSSKFKKED